MKSGLMPSQTQSKTRSALPLNGGGSAACARLASAKPSKICLPARAVAWEMRAMTRSRAALIFLAVWAAVYLPGLGSTELKGEEGRRILPAVTMLETGNWLVPYLGGKPYLRKPPMMNWLLAFSFKATGVRNEWTARLPSALTVLALGLTIVGVSGAGWMKPETALVAAIMATTSFGLLAKARFAGAEIEGVYGPLFGIAITLWLAWRAKGAS